MDALIRNKAEKRGLFKLRCQALAKRLIEDWIAGGVGEIGEHDGVFVC